MAVKSNKNKHRIYFTPEMLVGDDFFKYPRWLLGTNLSNDARTLYAILLDRCRLSYKNHWIDDEGLVYFYYSKESMQNILGIGRSKCYELYKELVNEGFIEQIRQGQGKNNRLYLLSIDEEEYNKFIDNYEKLLKENDDNEYRKTSKKRMSEEKEPQTSGKRMSESEDSQTSEKWTSRHPKNGLLDVRKTDRSKTEYSKTEYSNLVSDSVQDSNNLLLEDSETGVFESETESKSDTSFEYEVISKLDDYQYRSYKELLRMTQIGELPASRESLLQYFEIMRMRGWKDMSGRPIRDIVAYVCSNFHLHELQRQEEKEIYRKIGKNPLDAYAINSDTYARSKRKDNEAREELLKTGNDKQSKMVRDWCKQNGFED